MNPLTDSILCRTAVQISPTATGTMMYMPGGRQTITPFGGGVGKPITIQVDAAGARELERQRSALAAKGKRPYFDFNHSDGEASFWPEEFFWQDAPEPGIYCRGEWTADGKAKVEGKAWRQFSPVFHVDNKHADPARIVCRETAKPNMGGLVNDPAFHSILPLWAKDAANADATGAHPDNTKKDHMNEQELAALRAKNQELQNEIDALRAKNADAAAIAAKQAEKRAVEAEINAEASRREVEALKAKNAEQETAIKARNKADAEAAVKDAVNRGAIAAKDTATQDVLVQKGTEDPAFLSVIKAMQGQPLSGRITPTGSVQVTNESANAKIKAYAAIVAANAGIRLSEQTSKEKGKLAREAAAIFAKDIESDNLLAGMTIEDAIKAADVSDAQVGLLSGSLVLQRSLPLLQYEFPILSSITSDYSDAPGLFQQSQVTRIITKPAVQTYNPAADSAGRPRGWDTTSPAQAVDVEVKLDEHIGIPIVFGVNTLSRTVRNLFAEQASMVLYALGERLVGKVTGLMTAANFNAYAATSVGTGATTNGSATITAASTANMYPGQAISGTGIPANTYVASITNSTTAVLTQAATATGSSLTFTLGGGAAKIPTTYATYVKALASFGMVDLGNLAAAFDTNEVPMQDRFALLNSQYFTKLSQDNSFNTFWAATQKPDVITDRALPRLQSITPINAPYFPSGSNRVGFAGHRASLLLQTRLPQDFTSAVGAMVPGSVTTVTAPGGISVLLVQYVNLQGNYAEWRPEVMMGSAVGDRRAGLVLTSA